jgi:hypothetical protein
MAVACCVLAACGPDTRQTAPAAHETNAVPHAPAPRTPTPGHTRMLEHLQEVADGYEQMPYLGSGVARDLRVQLEALPADAPVGERVGLNFRLGTAEIIQGNEETAIAHLELARELLPKTHALANRMAFELGVAYMRLGETQNCCLKNDPDSCILPIRGGGLHVDRAGASRAAELFVEVLQQTPTSEGMYFVARWLLNIAHMTLGSYPDGVPGVHRIPPEAFRSSVDFPRFENVAARLGLGTFSLSGGAIVDDFDNDGYLDIVASTWDPEGQLQIFRNDGDGTFSNRTRQAGLDGLLGGLNLVQTDYDNDGNLDFLVLRGAWLGETGRIPNSLVRNNGDFTFTDVTFDAGLGDVHYPTQVASWADWDNDGDLDLYIGNEARVDLDYEGKAVGPDSGVDARSQLFRNNGDGTFTDVAEEAGVASRGYPKGAGWGDYDGDRLPDLYVSEYSAPNRLYHNNGDGTFTDVAAELSVTKPIKGFPTWFWDFDNDGSLDLYAASYSGRTQNVATHYSGLASLYELPALYRGDGRGGFEEMAREAGLDYPILPMGANFGDLDNDGFLDFYLGTGDPSYHSLMPNLMYLNRGGSGFVDVTMAGGFGHLQKGHGIAFADLDNDGDADVFEQMGGAFPGDRYYDALYENPGFGNGWITVKLVGVRSNRAAIGARIRLRVVDGGKERSIYRYVNSGGSFGGNPLRQTIGIGKAERIASLEVYWPTSDETQRFEDVAVGQAIRIVEGEDGFGVLELKKLELSPGGAP